jgi:hypothetical protein
MLIKVNLGKAQAIAQANSLGDLICKITRAKYPAGIAQMVQHLLYKWKTLSSDSSTTTKVIKFMHIQK